MKQNPPEEHRSAEKEAVASQPRLTGRSQADSLLLLILLRIKGLKRFGKYGMINTFEYWKDALTVFCG